MPVSKLYVEGITDLKVLKASLSLRPNNPQVTRKGTKDDLPHLVRRERQDSPGAAVVYLRDRDFDFEPIIPFSNEPSPILCGGIVHGYRWQKHEMESYLLNPKLVEEAFGVPVADTEAALLSAASSLRDYQAARWTMGQTRSQCRVGGLQTRPAGTKEFQLPADLSAAAVESWVTTATTQKLTDYNAALEASRVHQRFSDYQTKFANLNAEEILIWFSPKDLLAAMDSWRQRPEIKAQAPSDFCQKIIAWIEKGNGLRFFELVPEVESLAQTLTA